jgi:hypothetical protein
MGIDDDELVAAHLMRQQKIRNIDTLTFPRYRIPRLVS